MEEENYFTSNGDHHWYGHVSDVQYDNNTFQRGLLVFLFLMLGIPLIIVLPWILVVLVALWMFRP